MTSTWDDWLAERAAVREQRGTVRFDPVLRLGGRHGVLDLASNDYLGLSQDPRVVAGAREALERYGASATASRLVTGTLPVHRELEGALARLTQRPTALVFSSGYTANLGALTALSGRGSQVLLDEHVHASLHDAARMSRAPHATFAHNDPSSLDAALRDRAGSRVVVAVESVYSVLGDAAPLEHLLDVCARHDALLLVDEAHGVGVAGRGRGLVHELGLAGDPRIVVTATLSKALGSQGGAVIASAAVRDHLVNTARTFIFDTGLAPAAAGAALAAVEVVENDPGLAGRVLTNAARLSRACGIETSAGAVQSIPMPSPEAAVGACLDLRRQGVLVGCFRPPSVPDGVSRLRVTARADLGETDLDESARRVRVAVDRHARPVAGSVPVGAAAPGHPAGS
jgi:8-amino-7-oxononanoate synthase